MKYLKLLELKIEKTFSDWLNDPAEKNLGEYELSFTVRKNWRFSDDKFDLSDIDGFSKKESGISIIDSICNDMDLDRESVLANENEIYDSWIDQEWGGKRNYIKFLNTFGLNFSESFISDSDFEDIKKSFNSSNIEKRFDSRSFGGTFDMISIKLDSMNKEHDQLTINAKSNKELDQDQKDSLKDFITGQLADEWGEKYSNTPKTERRGKLEFKTNIEFYWGVGYPDWNIEIN